MWPFRPGKSRRKAGSPLGPMGEKLAAGCLRGKGYKILARNYRCPAGEADIIALDRSDRPGGAETIVFVEVKTRSGEGYVDPESAVDARKRRQLGRVARYYLSSRDAEDCAVRFDIVAVVVPPGSEPRIRHTPGAFEPA